MTGDGRDGMTGPETHPTGTQPADKNGLLGDLRREAAQIRTGLDGVAGDVPLDRALMEQKIAGLCDRALALPPADAKAFAEDLMAVVTALDGAAARIAAVREKIDSGTKAATGRKATSAYGAAMDRRRRGF